VGVIRLPDHGQEVRTRWLDDGVARTQDVDELPDLELRRRRLAVRGPRASDPPDFVA
jgi:hypothetical protein